MAGSPRWAHTRLLGGPWLACAVVVPVVLAVAASLTGRAGTEDDLTRRTRTALADSGVGRADVRFDGVVGTVQVRLRSLPDGMSSRELQTVVDGVAGARSISVEIPRRPGLAARGQRSTTTSATPTATPSAPPAADCAEPQAAVDAILGPDRVAFGNQGAVLPDAERAQVAQVAAVLAGCGLGADVVGHTADRAPAGSTVGVERARAVAAVLREGGVEVGRVQGRRDGAPLGDNATQAGRVLNRYATIKVRQGG